MVVGAFHHRVQKGVLAVGCRVGPVAAVWKDEKYKLKKPEHVELVKIFS